MHAILCVFKALRIDFVKFALKWGVFVEFWIKNK